MIDLSDLSAKPEVPYMTDNEAYVFKQLRRTNTLSFFRAGVCKVCKVEVVRNKHYCGEKCWKAEHGEAEESEQGEVD